MTKIGIFSWKHFFRVCNNYLQTDYFLLNRNFAYYSSYTKILDWRHYHLMIKIVCNMSLSCIIWMLLLSKFIFNIWWCKFFEGQVIVFLKYYDVMNRKTSYVGHLYINFSMSLGTKLLLYIHVINFMLYISIIYFLTSDHCYFCRWCS